MVDVLTSHTFEVEGQTTHYLDGGPQDGTLIYFIHGWPDIALTWQHQLKVFAALGFRVVAPDTRGYGKSTAPKDKRAYALEQLTKEHLALLKHVGREKAIWVAHDWGCGQLSAIATHHPEVMLGAAWLAVPYRTLERGLNFLLTLINRDIYPEKEYPYGQWEYQKFYEEFPTKADEQLSPITEKASKNLYAKKASNPAAWGKPGGTSRILRDGGFFGGKPDQIPDIPLEATHLDEEVYKQLVDGNKRHGWFPATAYYLNHDLNEQYDEGRVNDGVLNVPCLYIDAKYDAVCSATTSPEHIKPMRAACKNLTEAWVDAAHWLHMEKPTEINAVLAKWLADSLPELWPHIREVKMHKL